MTNTIYVIVSGSKITPTPKVQCFHSEFGEETIEDVQHIIDVLLKDGRVKLSSLYFNDISLCFGSDVIEGIPVLDIYFNTEVDDTNMYVIDMTPEFMESIKRN